MTSETQNDLSGFLTVNQLVEKHRFVTQGGVRAWIFNGKENGFNSCLRRIGRKILINEPAFIKWLEEHRVQP